MPPEYHCSVPGCIYAEGSGRHFSTKKFLNQHYTKVHAVKQFVCSKCQRGFGNDWFRKSHEATCGQKWQCTCDKVYTSRESLLTHSRRTQHSLPSDMCHPQKKTSSNSRKNPQVVVPLVFIVQPSPPQISTSSGNQVCSSQKQRPILPKADPTSTLPLQIIAALALSELATQTRISKSSVGVQTENSFNIPESTAFDLKEQKQSGSYRSKYSSESGFNKPSTKTIGSQTSDTYFSKKNSKNIGSMTGSELRETRKRNIRSDSILIQTTQSHLMKSKRKNFSKSPKNHVHYKESHTDSALNCTSNNVSTGTLNNNTTDSHSVWSDLETIFRRSKDVGLSPCGSYSLGTQTSPGSAYCEQACNSYSLNEGQISWPKNRGDLSLGSISTLSSASQLENNLSQHPENDITLSPLLSSSSSLTFCSKGTHIDGPIFMNSHSEYLNSETQTDLEGNQTLLPYAMVQQAVQTDFQHRPYTHIHTQTSDLLDYSNVLANMETQTTEDFLFSNLELSDIETQTPWDDISSLNDPLEVTDQLSIEIQTDFTSSQAAAVQNSCNPYSYLMNSQQLSSCIANRHSAISVMDMETQTNYDFSDPGHISSYAQTLDQLSHDIFYS